MDFAIASAIVLLGAATLLAGLDDWLPALLGNFRPQIAGIALVLSLLVTVTRWRPVEMMGLAAIALAVWLGNTLHMSNAMPHAVLPASDSDSITLRVVFANVLSSNTEFHRLIGLVERENADLLIASEVTDRWVAELQALRPRLPHGHGMRHGDLVILSRLPMTRPTENLSVRFARMASAEIETLIGPVAVLAAHPTVPLGAERTAIRDRALATLGARAAEASGGVVLAGDFNATPWSPPFEAMVRRAGVAFGPGARRTTWPLWLPDWMGIPIDHVLAGKGCVVVDRRHGPDIDSDHWPIVANIRCFSRLSAP